MGKYCYKKTIPSLTSLSLVDQSDENEVFVYDNRLDVEWMQEKEKCGILPTADFEKAVENIEPHKFGPNLDRNRFWSDKVKVEKMF